MEDTTPEAEVENTEQVAPSEDTAAKEGVDSVVPPETVVAPEQTVLGAADEVPADGAPETYEAYQVPEGATLDADLVNEANVVFKELGLSQAQAQKLVDFELQQQAKAQQAFQQATEAWISEGRSDAEIGGPNWEVSVADARKAINAFGNDGLKEVLNTSGLGNHPEVIRAFAKIGKLTSEDGTVQGDAIGPSPSAEASLLFPTMMNQ